MVVDVKSILYSVIDDIGRDKIRSEVSSDIHTASRKYCEEIVKGCLNALGTKSDSETLGTLCEALLHFMLTASLIPSERKVMVNGKELDIVIPSVKNLTKDPSKTLVVQVIKTTWIDRIRDAEIAQPHGENIWVVSFKPLDTGHKNYSLMDNYPQIISDIQRFLSEQGVHGLKMLHS